MDARGVAARIHDLPAAPRRALMALMLAVTAALAWWGIVSVSPDLPIALWWPAAATGSAVVLVSRGHRIAVAIALAVITGLLHVAAGRPLELSLVYGIALGAEAWVVARLLTRGRAHAHIRTLYEMGRVLISSAVGALVIAVVGGAGAWLIIGADPALAALSLFTSHSSALFTLLPLALVPLTVPMRVPPWEPIVQTAFLVLLILVVFGPGAPLALTFLIVTTLMWGAFRLPPLIPALQTILLAITATVATAWGIGPFAELAGSDERAAIFTLHLFLLTHAAAGVFVAAQSAEWITTTEALAAREHDATFVADELKQLNAQKDDFISAVSHELRTPVTSILGFSEQLVETRLDPETEQAGRIIHRNARRLADVIEDVLELSRLSTTQGSNRPPADLELSELVRDCVADAEGLSPRVRGVRVDLRLPEHPVVIHAVSQDLQRIVTNLLSNALKFSPADGTVTIAITESTHDVEVRFVDEGPGIPLAEQEAVWERFYRVQSPRHRDVPGTGLGLPIVRALVEHRVGGSVSLHSDGEHGTSVSVRIPRSPLPTAAGQRWTAR